MWHNRAEKVKSRCRFLIYLYKVGVGELTLPLQNWIRERPHKKDFVSLAEGDPKGGLTFKRIDRRWPLNTLSVCKSWGQRNHHYHKGLKEFGLVCVWWVFLRAKYHLAQSATHRNWILHCELMAITQLSHTTHAVYRTELTDSWHFQVSQLM